MREINIVFAPNRNIWQMIEPAARNQPFSSDSFSEAVFLRDILHALDAYISDTNPVGHQVCSDEHLVFIASRIFAIMVEPFRGNISALIKAMIALRHGYDLAKFICRVIQ